ncbi:MAG: Protein GrpE [Microgenomates group bacterium GW2011_GWF2_45_18]|nr:MAG: Protein GrpE [Microgenomates group bacterium GW2011_GWF1_44_10]KKU02158.1 MAG: Protein GrpE [Microgenomates group bacterium GW2011_GWF2_45_18]HAU98708.1 nucleotide exchange factor GrpE [Candidatus Paceibacterota bacterium]HAX01866.1 nucleotide exchange factor GrpE [Candidatus Paceibacterota bacterium]
MTNNQTVADMQQQDDALLRDSENLSDDINAKLNSDDALADQHEECKTQLHEMEQKYLRTVADYQNLSRRTQGMQEKMIKLASKELALAILEPLDHLYLALEHTKDSGIEMIARSFSQSLESQGIQEMQIVGELFDPDRMEAVAQVQGKKDVVIRVQQKGYMMYDLVLRPAKVEVGTGALEDVVKKVTE